MDRCFAASAEDRTKWLIRGPSTLAARVNVAFLGVVPYSLCHGGASHEALTEHRNLAQNKPPADAGVQTAHVQRYKKKNVPCNASPCSTPRPWQAIQKSLLGLCAQPSLTLKPPDVGLCRPRSSSACELPNNTARSSICPRLRTYKVGPPTAPPFAHPADRFLTRLFFCSLGGWPPT